MLPFFIITCSFNILVNITNKTFVLHKINANVLVIKILTERYASKQGYEQQREVVKRNKLFDISTR